MVRPGYFAAPGVWGGGGGPAWPLCSTRARYCLRPAAGPATATAAGPATASAAGPATATACAHGPACVQLTCHCLCPWSCLCAGTLDAPLGPLGDLGPQRDLPQVTMVFAAVEGGKDLVSRAEARAW